MNLIEKEMFVSFDMKAYYIWHLVSDDFYDLVAVVLYALGCYFTTGQILDIL